MKGRDQAGDPVCVMWGEGSAAWRRYMEFGGIGDRRLGTERQDLPSLVVRQDQ